MPRITTRRLARRTSKAFKRKKTVASVTKDDIDVMLRLAGLYNTSYDFDAAEWFWDEFKKPITFEEFRNKYPQGSKGAQLFERFTSKLELAGTLIEYAILITETSMQISCDSRYKQVKKVFQFDLEKIESYEANFN